VSNGVHPILRRSLTIAAAVLGAAILVAVVLLARRPDRSDSELGASFKYDLTSLRRVDPALIVADEQSGFAVAMAGPAALAMGPSNTIIVGGAGEVAWYDASGTRLDGFRTEAAVSALAADEANGNLVVAFRDRIAVRGRDGATVAAWGLLNSNAVCTGVAVVGDTVFVADAGNRQVIGYGPDGGMRMRLGGKDTEYKEGFVIPSPYFPLQKAADDTLWVVDTGRHRFINFTPAGRIRASWERAGMTIEGFCGCCNPTHFALREDGSFVTTEKGLARVKIHAPNGDLVGVVAAPDAFDPDVRGLAVVVDEAGRILVLDPQRKRIRVFHVREGR
jgi:hypothetical protein